MKPSRVGWVAHSSMVAATRQEGSSPRGHLIVRLVAPSWYDPPDMPTRKSPLPALGSLHLRHPGLYEPLCRAYADAAAICLSESHTSPVEFEIRREDTSCLRDLGGPGDGGSRVGAGGSVAGGNADRGGFLHRPSGAEA